jgi:hypothetical protein
VLLAIAPRRAGLRELLSWGAGLVAVLTYAGALVLESCGVSTAVVGLGLGAGAVAMVPGTFAGRRGAARATPARLARLTACQGGAVLVLGAARTRSP